MKSWNRINVGLFLALAGMSAFAWFVPERDVGRPNYEFVPERQMSEGVAYDSFSPNENFPDGLTLRTPPVGAIARGQMPLHYKPTVEDGLRAGLELQSPFARDDTARRDRGTFVFTNYCQVCHGPLGQGNGPVTQGGFPPPSSLLADRAVQMTDGQMFHVLTYGQQNMPAFNAQLSREDRWSVILHVRMLQGPSTPSAVPSRFQAVTRLFRENCAACHGEDGSGNNLRKVWRLIPDFTSLAWQMSQTEMALVNQIEYGSHPLMPAFRYKLPTEQILSLAVYVRSFAGHPAAGVPVPPSSNLTAANVYGTYCFACHDTTGKGNRQIRPAMPELPDFTSATWQKSRKDTDLAQSILLGKGKFMLPNADKLGTVDMKQMVALVRGFEGGKQIVPVEEPKAIGPQVPVLVETPVPPSKNMDADAQKKADALKGEQSALQRESEETAARIRMGASIFRQYCIVCHGTDGTGTAMRPALPPIPDFRSPTFHAERSDAQLVVSILDGKGTLMPANRGRVTDVQAADLAAYVRAFGPKAFAIKPHATDTDFDKAYRQLEEQWKELQKELQKVRDKK